MGLSFKAYAEPAIGLSEILEKEILPLDREIQLQSLSEAEDHYAIVASVDGSDTHQSPQPEVWSFAYFGLAIRGRGTFQIPLFVSIQIIPEITMIWQRLEPLE